MSGTPSNSANISLRVCAIMLVMYALYFARAMVVPIVTAMVVYLALRPIVRRARAFRVSPAIGAALIILGLALSMGLGIFLVIVPAQNLLANTPRHAELIQKKLSFITDRLQAFDRATDRIAEADDADEGSGLVDEGPVPVEIKQAEWSSRYAYLSGTGNVLTFITITIALLYFLLATGDNLINSIIRSHADITDRQRVIEVIANVQEGLGNYLAQVSVINACLGVVVGLTMWVLGMPSPFLWGVMAFAFNFIPIIGALSGAAILFLVALVHFEPTHTAFLVTAVYLTLTSLEGQFITPSILGRSMSMSPVLVFLSIVIWGWMWGFIGVFLSIPLLIAARMTCESYEELMPLAKIIRADSSHQTRAKDG